MSVPEVVGRIVLFCEYLKMLEELFYLSVPEDAGRLVLSVCT